MFGHGEQGVGHIQLLAGICLTTPDQFFLMEADGIGLVGFATVGDEFAPEGWVVRMKFG